MKFRTAVALLLASAGAVAGEHCHTFMEEGQCFDPKQFYVNDSTVDGIQKIVDASGDSATSSVHKQ